jgi:thiosulfate dehydrogenase [quinone] large subunit
MAAKKAKKDNSVYAWALVRITLGFVFLWAFFDKLFGLGFSTCRDKADAVHVACSQAWIHGGSPTAGFLGHAVQGPFAGFYHHLADKMIVDWLFMAGLLVVGVGLLLGVYVRWAALVGVAMLALMWSSLLWPANNPFVDEHIVYIFALAGIYSSSAAQDAWSLKKFLSM